MNEKLTYSQVQDYYGKVLQTSSDLKTDACCTDEGLPNYLKPILSKVHDEVLMRYYGCGLVLPEQLAGTRILDLGSGAGRDVYALSALVGESGEVVGVDMTEEQLDVANRYRDFHADVFGFERPNVTFHKGYIERLNELDLAPSSFDIIVSNCVINLSPDKASVLRQCYELLKPGGEVYFSDVYAERRTPQHLIDDEELYGECISGALYWNDFINLAKSCGFKDPRLVKSRPLAIENPALQQKIGDRRFYSATYRLFKLDDLEPACEDYGQAVRYKGTVDHHRDQFVLDEHHVIETEKMFPVCGNTYRMLADTRFAEHFEFFGDWQTHYGIFEGCGSVMPFSQGDSESVVRSDSACC
ncbi:methyltransferase domain-containing protein [Arenicella xantha]|uniref:Arsenite methyltransferase n=1 Tax=Arenicella xantha TaxID=644221 RepID=A0A395JJ59_9GAMM|nr:methyltransferase domain-containing protein [Arenicella xantha]RBP49799.1 methyltransferase family protein [Arenicella xantha]